MRNKRDGEKRVCAKAGSFDHFWPVSQQYYQYIRDYTPATGVQKNPAERGVCY
jgi:hypothetical protein